jgi:hypothetical protein
MPKSKTKKINSRKERGNPENRNAGQMSRQEERLHHAEEVKKLQGTIKKQAKESIEDKATIKQQAKDLCEMKGMYGDACRDRDIHKCRADIYEKSFYETLKSWAAKHEMSIEIKDGQVTIISNKSGIKESIGLEESNQPKQEQPHKPQEEPQVELNYFAPTKNIQMLLKQVWFKELRTDDKYDEKWTDDFMNVFMSSEWKTHIVQEWDYKDKRMKLKCMMIGLLKDNGVLKGSYSKIARQLNFEGEDVASLANYMGQGKKQGYALWVSEYVKNH